LVAHVGEVMLVGRSVAAHRPVTLPIAAEVKPIGLGSQWGRALTTAKMCGKNVALSRKSG
jgi:hypothetical protein